MERKALYAGSFDPLTNGHLDIIERAAKMFDHLYVAVATNTSKQSLFSGEEKLALLREVTEAIANVEVIALESELTVHFAEGLGAKVLVRGLRNTVDFEYEAGIAAMNQLQNANVETIFLLADEKYRYVSSSLVKEVAKFNGELSTILPQVVIEAMADKLQ